jgi:GntR family transcriptional repressor for pyruvate dehydrogenase complex
MDTKTKPRSKPPAPEAPRHRAVRIPKAGEVVAGQFRQRIIRGELKEGDTLPQESELVAQFGVSRPTLREAFRILEAEGLISISRGTRGGALVHRPDARVAARYMGFMLQTNNVSLDDVYSTLALVEPAAVRIVAEKATKAQVAELRAQLAEMASDIDDDRKYGAALARFHRTLVDQAGLRSLTLLVDMLTSVVEGYIVTVQTSARGAVDHRPAKVKSMKAKEKLVDLIEAHSADEAEAAWKKYLEVSRAVMLRWQPPDGVNALAEFLYSQPR